jgi:hypothetical protein
MEPAILERVAIVRDTHLAPLFRRWPSLSRRELSELKRLYHEQLRVARYVGRFAEPTVAVAPTALGAPGLSRSSISHRG